jgi:lipoate-protein ligase A
LTGLNYVRRKVQELIKVDAARSRRLGVIKRFTGGGTVVVDADTIFTTLIMQVSALRCVDFKHIIEYYKTAADGLQQ